MGEKRTVRHTNQLSVRERMRKSCHAVVKTNYIREM